MPEHSELLNDVFDSVCGAHVYKSRKLKTQNHVPGMILKIRGWLQSYIIITLQIYRLADFMYVVRTTI